MPQIRLNKYLAQMGVASRRAVDGLIAQGKVKVGGKLAVLGQKIDPENEVVTVGNHRIGTHPTTLVYYLLNKPKYVLSTTTDDRSRKTVLDYVPSSPRVFPVGRLDYESTGLILLTNDGDLALKLTHPRYHLPKTYQVMVYGKINPDKIKTLERGVDLEDGRTAPCKVKIVDYQLGRTELEFTLYEGKKRQIRRMCSAVNLHVLELHRFSIGDIKLENVEAGKYRSLSLSEISKLKV